MHRRIVIAAVALLGAMAVPLAPASASLGDVMLVSVSASGKKANDNSYEPSISADGTTVAFVSEAGNLHPGDKTADRHLYVKNLKTGKVVLASTTSSGKLLNLGIWQYSRISLSADGTKVAFATHATNADARDVDTTTDLYVKDLVTGKLTLVSTSASGQKGNGDSGSPSLSADGSKIAFYSLSGNLHPSAGYGGSVFRKDLKTGKVDLVGAGDMPSLSADGNKVAFVTLLSLSSQDKGEGSDVYVKNLSAGTVKLASITKGGTQGNSGKESPFFRVQWPSISADGSKVAFTSYATNLSTLDKDAQPDVYVKDLTSGGIVLADTDDKGKARKAASTAPALSGDGSAVAFNSDSAVYVKHLGTGRFEPASARADGTLGYGGSASMSGNGRQVAFVSSFLHPADTDDRSDIYRKDLWVDWCAKANATIVGTGGDDVIRGTSGNDVIWAGPGNDVVDGRGGNDVICGGPGNDTLRGSAGNDRLFGAGGKDILSGGAGNDLLFGGGGADKLYGGLGRDSLKGDAGADTMVGGEGADSLDGATGPDLLDGGAGSDVLTGGPGDDDLRGGKGSDELLGGVGRDQIRGGPGQDEIHGQAGADQLWGNDGNDVVTGDDGDDTLWGGPGNDKLLAGDGIDVCDGGSGVDTAPRCETTSGIP